jgi:hypothetical protein
MVSLLFVTVPLVCLAAQVEIPEGTKVRVRLDQPLSSATAEEQQPVQLAVTDDIILNEITVIPRDSLVKGTIVQAVPKRRMGRTGKLDFSIDEIIAPDGGKIPLRYNPVKKEGGSHAVRTGVITAGVAVLFWPAAPFMLLVKGKETTFNKGMTFEVFTDSKYTLKSKVPVGTTLLLSELPPPPAPPIATKPPPASLVNEDILKLKAAGFSDSLIISKIDVSPGAYKVDTDTLVELKKAGLSDDVIAAMIRKSGNN